MLGDSRQRAKRAVAFRLVGDVQVQMQFSAECPDAILEWLLVYAKPRAERWAVANLRQQGYETLYPRVATPTGEAPLFPRYIFVGRAPGLRVEPLRSTSGVSHIVSFGGRAVSVPSNVLDEVRARMDAQGFVAIEAGSAATPLFAKRERERLRVLLKLAEAGYRVRIA